MRVRLEKLKKSYKDARNELTVIEALDFEFGDASRNAIVGKSGIGKSTLLHVLGGLDNPNSGSVFYDDVNITTLSDEKLAKLRGSSVGFVFQFHHLLPEFSALENVAMPLLISGIKDSEAQQRAFDLLKEVGLEERTDHRPGQLSGGEQQRVAIARSLVVQPKLLLADEPTGNLDHQTAAEIQALIKSISMRFNTTLIIVTHNLELARSMDNVYEMSPGGALLRIER
jgi:lipoprotein-releasing system ATP-binding protein